MRELKIRVRGSRYLLPVAILKPSTPSDLTTFIATALLDTGATVSGIGPRVIAALGLESYGKNRLRSATDEAFVDYYLFRIGLFTTQQMTDAPGGDASLPFIVDEVDGFSWGRHADFDVILGMDILGKCDVTLSRNSMCSIIFG